MDGKKLTIDFLLDFLDLVAEDKVELEIGFDFFDAMHNGGVVLDADLYSDFVGAGAELLRDNKHSDLASVLDVGDTGFTTELFSGEIVILGNFVDDLLRGDGAELGGFIN